jgi:hypothetical protein
MNLQRLFICLTLPLCGLYPRAHAATLAWEGRLLHGRIGSTFYSTVDYIGFTVPTEATITISSSLIYPEYHDRGVNPRIYAGSITGESFSYVLSFGVDDISPNPTMSKILAAGDYIFLIQEFEADWDQEDGIAPFINTPTLGYSSISYRTTLSGDFVPLEHRSGNFDGTFTYYAVPEPGLGGLFLATGAVGLRRRRETCLLADLPPTSHEAVSPPSVPERLVSPDIWSASDDTPLARWSPS